jgi:N-acetylglucosamine-6-phosphate deacetylase
MTGSHFAIAARKIFDGHVEHGEGVVLIANGRIVGIAGEAPGGMPVDTWDEDVILAPGYIDAQVNGAGGVLLNATPTADAMAAMARAMAGTGTTTILPTLITDVPGRMEAALEAAREALKIHVPGVAGLHLEGPFLSAARHGAHPKHLVRRMTAADAELLAQPFPGCLLVTLAPEETEPGLIRILADAGVLVFAGHSDASYEQARAGMDAGVVGFTHLTNAMAPITGRVPGIAVAAMTDSRAHAGVIVDGIHVHPAVIGMALRLMGHERLFAVSDAMPTAASDITEFDLCGDHITLKDGRLTNPPGGLAGAHITMAECVRNLVNLVGVDWEIALRMATATPAEVLGLDDRGRIAPGLRADLLALDPALNVLAVWQGGVRL